MMNPTPVNLELVRPDAADATMRAIYDDTRRTLRLPWVGALFQGYAMYPGYLELAWNEVKLSLETPRFAADAEAIGNAADEAAERLYRPSYSERDVAALNLDPYAIRDTLDAFRLGNPKLLLVAEALRRSFEEGPVGGADDAGSRVPGSAPEGIEEARAQATPIELVDEAQAPESVRRVFDDIKATLGLPLVNSDYRAMAVWPDYLQIAWRDVKGVIGTDAHRAEVRRLTGFADEGVDGFASPVAATREAALHAGLPEDELDNLAALLRLFAGLLPGLILNVAMFYRALR